MFLSLDVKIDSLQEIEYPDGKVSGYHLHVGDKEESVDAYVMKSGKYGVSYRGIE